MGARGPKPGTPVKKIVHTRQALPADQLPSAPSHLDRTAKAAWVRLIDALNTAGILNHALDFGLLEIWCATYSQWITAQQALNKHGYTYTIKETGYVGQRPEVGIVNKAKTTLKALSAELGLSTAARARLSIPEPRPANEPTLRDILYANAVAKIEASKAAANGSANP